jgi:hypothetical protein
MGKSGGEMAIREETVIRMNVPLRGKPAGGG